MMHCRIGKLSLCRILASHVQTSIITVTVAMLFLITVTTEAKLPNALKAIHYKRTNTLLH